MSATLDIAAFIRLMDASEIESLKFRLRYDDLSDDLQQLVAERCAPDSAVYDHIRTME